MQQDAYALPSTPAGDKIRALLREAAEISDSRPVGPPSWMAGVPSSGASWTSGLLGAPGPFPSHARPVMADQTLTSIPYGEEYHVWPSAAGGAWMLMALDKPTFKLFR